MSPGHRTRRYPHPKRRAPAGGNVVVRPSDPAATLSSFLSSLRPEFDRSISLAYRAFYFWAVGMVARKMAPPDVLAECLTRFAREIGLTCDLGRYGAEDVRRLIQCAISPKHGRAAIAGVPPDPSQVLAVGLGGDPQAVSRRAVVDEIIKRGLSAGLPIGGRLQTAYILSISAEDIETLGARATNLYDLIPPRALEQPRVQGKLAAGEDTQPSPRLMRQRMKHAVDIHIAIVGSLVAHRPDLDWMLDALLGLSDGLAELDGGLSPPALMRSPRSPKAPRETYYDRVVKSLSAIAWAALVRLGVRKRYAAQEVARCLNDGRFLPPRQPNQNSVSDRSILNWVKRYEDDDLPPMILASLVFAKKFYRNGKTSAEEVLGLLSSELRDVQLAAQLGGGFRSLQLRSNELE